MEQLNQGGKSLSVQKAAKIMGKSEQFLRIGLQRGILPFGSAVKLSTHWTYYISPQRFFDYVGWGIERNGKDENHVPEIASQASCCVLHPEVCSSGKTTSL